ncbi:MAG: phosphoribosylglycinamide formyltransferase [Chryseolinea sp.]
MSATKKRIAIFASGSGTNAEEILAYFDHHPTIDVVLLLSNNPSAFALTRAAKFNVPTKVFTKEIFKDSTDVLNWLLEKEVTHIVLAGFLWLVPFYLTQNFPGKIINIHPALLPKFGGKGMYGIRVHEAIKSAGEKETGITIHLVDEKYDEGEILFQASCPVVETDTPEQIANNVHVLEHAHYAKVIEQWIKG